MSQKMLQQIFFINPSPTRKKTYTKEWDVKGRIVRLLIDKLKIHLKKALDDRTFSLKQNPGSEY